MLPLQIEMIGLYNSNNVFSSDTSVSRNRKTTLFELELPIESCGISYIDSDSRPVSVNTVILAKPGQTRHTKFPFKCYYIHFMPNDDDIYDVLTNLPNFIVTEKYEEYKELYMNLCRYSESKTRQEDIIIQSLILQLIYSLCKDVITCMQMVPFHNSDTSILDILNYIREHLSEDLSLECMSRLASLSPTHFHRKFKAAVGQTLREYVAEQRIRKAIYLMQYTDMTLTQIALDCGFSSQSYFNYAFKRKMGSSPREYVRQLNQRYENR